MKHLLFMLFLFTSSFAQVDPDSVQKQAWNNFNSRYAGNWTIRWDESTGTPASIYGHRSEASAQIGAGAEAVAKSFFKQNQKIFKMRPVVDQLTPYKQFEHRGMHHLYFTQTYSGIPVFTGEYNITFGDDGSLRMVSGKFFPNIEIEIVPSVNASQAEQSVQKHLNMQSLR